MLRPGCLWLILLSAGCSTFHPATGDSPEPTRMEVAEALSLSTSLPLALNLDPLNREEQRYRTATQRVAPNCRLQFFTLAHEQTADGERRLYGYPEGGQGAHSAYLATYRRYALRSTFEQGKSELPEALKLDLNWFAESLKASALPPQVVVTGHANADGSDEFNLTLSGARARNTTRHLISAGIARDRIHLVAAGEFIPLGNVHPDVRRERSRRVELVTFIPMPERKSSAPGSCVQNNHRTVSVKDSGDTQ